MVPLHLPLPRISCEPLLGAVRVEDEGQPRFIRYAQQNDGTYHDVDLYDSPTKYADEKMYLHLKTGVNIGALRFGYKSAEVEFGLQAAINSIFQGFGGAGNLGFDGIYFIGMQSRLFEMVSLRVGLKHYSGHYGDEALEKQRSAPGKPIEYVRDNNLHFGLSATPIAPLRIYAEANLPMSNTWMHPAVHIPWHIIKRTSGKPLHQEEAGREKIATTDFADSFRAWIINTGVEYTFGIPFVGAGFAAFDLVLHQDGQTKHQPGLYDAKNPWELEYTIAAGVQLLDMQTGGKGMLHFSYHDGRFPPLNYFYQRTSYLSFGFAFNM